MYQTGQTKGYFSVLDRRTWRQLNGYGVRAMSFLAEGKLRRELRTLDADLQDDIEPLLGKNNPHLGKQKPLVGTNEPRLWKQKPLVGKNKPHLGKDKPLRGIEEPVLMGTHREVRIPNEETPVIDRALAKAVVSCEQNYAEYVDFCDPCNANLNETPKHVYTCRSTSREILRHSKLRRRREREPSRIPVRKIMQLMKRRKLRQKVKRVFRKSTPESSRLNSIASHYKLWYVNYLRRSDCFFSKFFKCQKLEAKRQQQEKVNCKYDSLSSFKLLNGRFCVSEKKLLMSGDIETNPGPMQKDNRQIISTTFSNLLLKFRLRQLGLRPQDVGGASDCFF